MRTILLSTLLVFVGAGCTPAPTPNTNTPPVSQKACFPSGCSSQICADEDMASDCMFRPEYACYKSATCERQPSGECGWTPSDALTACLANPPQE